MGGPTASVGTGLTTRAKRLFNLYALGRSHDLPAPQRDAAFLWAAIVPLACATIRGWVMFYLVYDAASLWPAAAFCAGFQITLIIPWIARRNQLAAEVCASVMIVALFTLLMWMFGAASDLNYAVLSFVLILIMEIGTRRPAAMFVFITPLIALFWALPIWFPDPQPFTNATPWLLETIQFANLSSLILVTLLMIVVILRRA